MEFFIDPNRCIGCQSCVQACSECDTHKGQPMIHLNTWIARIRCNRARRLYALRSADLCRSLPRRCHQTH
ncbi:MAG: 4Fe-4S binding protein [Blastocatellia bacterium]